MQGYTYVQVEYIRADGNPNEILKIMKLNDSCITQYNQQEQLITNTFSKHAQINLQELIDNKSKGIIQFTNGQIYILIEQLFLEIQRLQLLQIPHFNLQSQFIWILFEFDDKHNALSNKSQLIKYKVRFTNFLLFQNQDNKVQKDDKSQLIEICQQLIQYSIGQHQLKDEYWGEYDKFKQMTLVEIIEILNKFNKQCIDEKEQKMKKEFESKKEQKVDLGISIDRVKAYIKKQHDYINKNIKIKEWQLLLSPPLIHFLIKNQLYCIQSDYMVFHETFRDKYTLLSEYFELNSFEIKIYSSPFEDYFVKILKVQNIYQQYNIQYQYQRIFIHFLQLNGYLNSFEQFTSLDKIKYQSIKNEIKQQLYYQTLDRMNKIFSNSYLLLRNQLKYQLPDFAIEILLLKDAQIQFQNSINLQNDQYYSLENAINKINEKLSQYFKRINSYIQNLESQFLENLQKEVKKFKPLNLPNDEKLQNQIISIVNHQFKQFQIRDLEQFMTIDLLTLLKPIKQIIFESVKDHFILYINRLVEDIFKDIIPQEK